jgi:hypothetical protein
MKIKTFLFFSILTILTSCNGQTKNNASNAYNSNKHITSGDTVNKLGDHLWYVFQDKNNNYWFGSNGEGVRRRGYIASIIAAAWFLTSSVRFLR